MSPDEVWTPGIMFDTRSTCAFLLLSAQICISTERTVLPVYHTILRIFLSPPRLCFHWRVFVCKQDYAETVRPICTKFGEQVARWPRKKRLDYCGNSDLDQHPGTFWSFSVAVLALAKAPDTGFGNSPKIRRLENLRLNELKAAL